MNKQGPPEIWGGIECTINRLQDSYLDQLAIADLYNNFTYIESIIDLGLKQIRFPILWERHQPGLHTIIDWSFTENCLNTFRKHSIEPIAGLLHHGSGPAFTNLLEEDFPELFAEYAAKVATRFPRLQYYTPVNEPLTTARFSGLYGHWYPHRMNDVSFLKILLNELKGTVLAMHEIRKINPAAKLIQTEDLGKTYSTPLLSYQANFENNRRWLTWDILCGNFTKTHPLWDHVLRLGIEEQKLQFFIDNPCPPDIIGVNHYITSERFLDEDIEHYPPVSVGGNSLHIYADVEAVRVQLDEPHGIELLLKELWHRYKIPIAITEVHLNCSREEQLKWFHQVYSAAVKLNKEGIDIRAVTAWALFGSFGWNKLLTSQPFDYETGVFDISAGYARATALAAYIKDINGQQKSNTHLINQAAWWQLNSRYYKNNTTPDDTRCHAAQPIVIIGDTGTLGNAFSKLCRQRNLHHVLLGRQEADICDEDKLVVMINRYHPWAIVNAAGYVKVEEAETDRVACYKVNFVGVEKLAMVCNKFKIKLMSFSSDLVFDGNKDHPYVETDISKPLNTYGKSKQLAERSIVKENNNALLIRTAAFFGPWDKHNFVHHLLNTLQQGRIFVAADDIVISPTYVPHLVNASLDLLIDDATGAWHLTNKENISWYGFAKKIVGYTSLNADLVIAGYNIKTTATLPRMSALGSIKYNLMPSLEQALAEYFSTVHRSNQILRHKNKEDERV